MARLSAHVRICSGKSSTAAWSDIRCKAVAMMVAAFHTSNTVVMSCARSVDQDCDVALLQSLKFSAKLMKAIEGMFIWYLARQGCSVACIKQLVQRDVVEPHLHKHAVVASLSQYLGVNVQLVAYNIIASLGLTGYSVKQQQLCKLFFAL